MFRATSARDLALPLALVALVLALYARTAGHEFADYDAEHYLTGNPRVLAGLTADGVAWAFTSFDAANWHPLTWLCHMLDVELFGLAPSGHHLENAAWHAANSVLVFALFLRLGLARAFAFAGALFFAIHPLRVESVAWFVERKDLLSFFFGVASLNSWLGWRRSGGSGVCVPALALYACSLLSKGTFVTMPALLLLFEVWLFGRSSLRWRRSDLAWLGFAVLALGGCVVTVCAQGGAGAIQDRSAFPLDLRLANALDSCVWYVRQTFFPGQLACYYPWAAGALGERRLVLDATLLVAISAAALALRRRAPGVLVGWLWFLGSLVPLIGLVQIGTQAHADRYSLFPCLGLAFAACHLAERELLPRIAGRWLASAASLAALALGLRTAEQVAVWRDTDALARNALAVTGANAAAYDLLATYYERTGRPELALPCQREALRMRPSDPLALANLGGGLVRARRFDEAEPLLERASEFRPGRWQTWHLLGAARLGRGRYREALSAFDLAVMLEPREPGNWANRALAVEELLDKGSVGAQADEAWRLASLAEGPLARPHEALRFAACALARASGRAEVLDVHALACAASGDFRTAVKSAGRALELARGADPAFAERIERRLAAYHAGRIDRVTRR